MSVAQPPPPLPPAVTVSGASPRPTLPSIGANGVPRHPSLPHAHSDFGLDISRTPSPASSSSSANGRPGILRSASVGDHLCSASPISPASAVQFAPLPQIAPRKRKSTRSLGLAARSQMLKAQAERRANQQEQDLAWEDLAQLMKDAQKLFKRVVGKGSAKGKAPEQSADGSASPQAGDEETTVQDFLVQQHVAQLREKPLPELDERPRSPPPLAPYLGGSDQDDSGDGERRDSGTSEDPEQDAQDEERRASSVPDDESTTPTPTGKSVPASTQQLHHHEQAQQLP
ncbi:hypothetical protein EXIGLDRAFT_733788 [Exidia glandulosa HHB12029]|uniref:Uncharacterized protein n=1 Tax=Exidia glandulosa HHB12029 TaxID=1314781 RepID=A0A165F360_EXIGL|nr:hypothetical protein EXIGLDRAFT_722813 [Exidia glandulosa HHB12029]KZV96226.1 hypothetical protein EXIGLDRAFT_733788 [Exidia glandulosa HHB12029]